MDDHKHGTAEDKTLEDPCSSPECLAAGLELMSARNAIIPQCSLIRWLAEQIRFYVGLAMTALAWGMVLIVFAMIAMVLSLIGLIPNAVALVMFILAAIPIVAALLLFALVAVYRSQLRAARDEMARLRQVFDEAVEKLMRACAPICWRSYNLNQPAC